MRTPSARGFVAAAMLAMVALFAAACGSRTGDYGFTGGDGGKAGCRDVGRACSSTLQCCDSTCDNGFCGGSCTPDGLACDVDGECCTGDCVSGICGAGECLQDGFACVDSFECCSGSCDGGVCGFGECVPDGGECFDGQQCCGGSCLEGVCASPACTHDECQQGAPLSRFCTDCTLLVCDVDPFCCDTQWDEACVSLAEIECGLPCSTCSPNGAFCGSNSECCSDNCDDGICANPCLPDGAGCGFPGECCSGQCSNGFCGPGGDCSHDECTTGGPLAFDCSDCTGQICAADPFCCDQFWDGLCVDEAEQFCGLDCGLCTPDGQFCNSPVECCSGACNGNICGQPCTPDGGFCSNPGDCCTGVCNGNICGQPCTPDGGFCNVPDDCCNGQCNNSVCGPGGDCSHDECTLGGPLLTSCTPCAAQVCAADPFCCQQGWDSICVDEAEQLCGLNCGACTPDGQGCGGDGECCSGSCNNNVCGPPCQPDGTFCFDPDQCCSGSCNNFQCGGCLPDGFPCSDGGQCCAGQCNGGFCGAGPVCPSDGSPCGDCVADNCCGQLVTCLTSPGCFDDILCFQQCTQGGNSAPLCFFQCINDPAAFDVIGCLVGNCAGACL